MVPKENQSISKQQENGLPTTAGNFQMKPEPISLVLKYFRKS